MRTDDGEGERRGGADRSREQTCRHRGSSEVERGPLRDHRPLG